MYAYQPLPLRKAVSERWDLHTYTLLYCLVKDCTSYFGCLWEAEAKWWSFESNTGQSNRELHRNVGLRSVPALETSTRNLSWPPNRSPTLDLEIARGHAFRAIGLPMKPLS
jgi:hypothetical protein